MKKARHHSWLVTLPLVAIVAAYLWLVFLPGQRKIHALQAELAEKRAFIADGHRVSLSTARVEHELADLQSYCQQWQAQPRDSAQRAALFGRIAELLKASGVATTHFAPGQTQKLDLVQNTPLRIKCTGSFQQLASVVAGLEKMSERLWLEDIKLEIVQEIGAGEHAQDAQAGQIMRCELGLAIFAGNSKKFD